MFAFSLILSESPAALYLVHFKSRDLSKLHRHGQFWHIFFTQGGALISQDEKDTWTVHVPIPLDLDCSTLDPKEAVCKTLGGPEGPVHIDIDEVLVTSSWRPNICLADEYISKGGRVFLSGDSAHQNIPTGGYGMNTAVGDSFDIAWKIAAVVAGYGGDALLRSYEEERQPVAARNIDQSGAHWSVHAKVWGLSADGDAQADDSAGQALRARITETVLENDAENKAHGMELGYRYYKSSVINRDSEGGLEPEWKLFDYVPSTWPGVRAPHVFLKDGKTSIFDCFGSGSQYTLVDFSADGQYASVFDEVASRLAMPLKIVLLPEEKHARQIWEREAVLIRPDDHVCWRSPLQGGLGNVDVENVLLVSIGQRVAQGQAQSPYGDALPGDGKHRSFTATIGNVNQTKVEKLASFQQ
ncbi:MAG: hypothetical protein CL912_33050 [Deltaproteobacteria bacterium]|nr:hypothetical protein [Deltaproteobacteria bacterium]